MSELRTEAQPGGATLAAHTRRQAVFSLQCWRAIHSSGRAVWSARRRCQERSPRPARRPPAGRLTLAKTAGPGFPGQV